MAKILSVEVTLQEFRQAILAYLSNYNMEEADKVEIVHAGQVMFTMTDKLNDNKIDTTVVCNQTFNAQF